MGEEERKRANGEHRKWEETTNGGHPTWKEEHQRRTARTEMGEEEGSCERRTPKTGKGETEGANGGHQKKVRRNTAILIWRGVPILSFSNSRTG